MKKSDFWVDKYFWSPLLFLLENPFVIVPFFFFFWFLCGCFVPTVSDNYSNGVREGLLQKYTVKGFIWKTGEGEIVLNSFRMHGRNDYGGSENFCFSDKQRKDYFKFVGKNVKVFYTQALHRPYSEGGTNYRLDSIQVLE